MSFFYFFCIIFIIFHLNQTKKNFRLKQEKKMKLYEIYFELNDISKVIDK